MRLSKRWLALLGSLTAIAVAAFALVNVKNAEAAGTSGGAAAIVNPQNNLALASGGSQTNWTFKLPAPTADRCTGDSATGGYFVYTYITPVRNNPAALTFNGATGPDNPTASFAYPLFDTSGQPFIARNTATQTGQVAMFPGTQFNFNRFSTDGRNGTIVLPAGAYNVGVACNGPSGHDKFWNTVIDIRSSSTDVNGQSWLVGPPPQTTTALLSRPIRLLDTRLPAPGTKLAKQQTIHLKVVDVPVGGIRIPPGAVGVIGTLTVTQTESLNASGGYLTVYPFGNRPTSTSSINWFGVNQNLATSVTVGIDPATGQISIENGLEGGSAPTHVIFDAVGYVF